MDPTRPFTGDATLKLLTSRDDAGMSTLWHSSAHLMAEALESLYPGIKFWVGPPVENGFYYDVDFEAQLHRRRHSRSGEEDDGVGQGQKPFLRKEMSKADAVKYLRRKETSTTRPSRRP